MAGPYLPIEYRAEVDSASIAGPTAPGNRYKEWYSWSVVASTVSAAGLVPQIPVIDVNKVDVLVTTWEEWRGRQRTFALQLKSTQDPAFVSRSGSRHLAYELDSDTYNNLLAPSTIPRFLVVVATPEIGKCWVRQRPSIFGLSAAAWWYQVKGPRTNNASSKTVHIPVDQRFDSEALNQMLLKA